MKNINGRLREVKGYYHTIIEYPGADGKTKQKSQTTGLKVKGNKKRAQEILDQRLTEFKNKFERAQPVDVSNVKFTDFMNDWLDVVEHTVEVTTFASYKTAVEQRICPYFDEKHPKLLLRELTPKMIQDYYTYEMKVLGNSANTVVHRHANLHRALKYAVKMDLLDTNPVDKVDRPKKGHYESDILTSDEIKELFEAVKGTKIEFAVLMAAFYGLRREEIVGLKWKNIDFENKSFTISCAVTEACIDGKQILVKKDNPKTKSSNRTFPLMPLFEQIFLNMKKYQGYYREICGNCYNNEFSEYVYVNEMGDLIKPGYITQKFSKILEDNGFRHIRFHDLRHSCATILHKGGIGMKDIQMWLGHSNIGTTSDIYTHFDDDSKVDSANVMLSNLMY